MTIANVRDFLRLQKTFLKKRGVIKDGCVYKKINILDVAGFFHKIIVSQLKQQSWEPIKYSIINFLKGRLSEMEEGQELILVFDPLELHPESPVFSLKTETINKRGKAKDIVKGFGYSEVNKIKRCIYHLVKQEFPDLRLVVSQYEADIMIGSLVRYYTNVEKINKDDITIFSTDCDMLVFGYGCLYQDFKEIIDTTLLFKLFGYYDIEWVAAVPEYLGCDYQTQKTRSLSSLHELQNLKREGLIYDVYLNPQKYENKYDLTYSSQNWEKQILDLFINNREERAEEQELLEDLDQKIKDLSKAEDEEQVESEIKEDRQSEERNEPEDLSQEI